MSRALSSPVPPDSEVDAKSISSDESTNSLGGISEAQRRSFQAITRPISPQAHSSTLMQVSEVAQMNRRTLTCLHRHVKMWETTEIHG